jgi:type II secretory pathway pseudopilin PulG
MSDAMDGKLLSYHVSPLRRIMRRFGVMRRRQAFTLVELMLVIVLMTLFFGMGLGSNKAMNQQLAFMREQDKVITKIYETRSKVLASYANGTTCGFGIGIKDDGIFTFQQDADGGSCRSEYLDGEVGSSQSSPIPLDGAYIADSNFGALLFVPPHLDVAYNYMPGGSGTACFVLQSSANSQLKSAIKVNRAGQISVVESCN